jgi:hypothetical protein
VAPSISSCRFAASTSYVLLLHDGRAARTRDGDPVVLRVLPRLLERLEADGLTAVPLPAPARIPPA